MSREDGGGIGWVRQPRNRLRLAITLFAVSFAAQFSSIFLSQDTLTRVTNFISWSAIWITSLDIVATTDVRKTQEEADAATS